ncbi:MAG: carbohydrate kinase family protein [Candidatus Hydrogenedentes bacterium]|nr:carbohydrate kinase family protein [Candidatus Hydrogenedentota bacterium]
MKIGLLGAVCFDEIIALDGTRSESFGGILYNASAFSSILNDADCLAPVSRLGADRYQAALNQFRRLPHVDTTGLTRCPEPFTHVQLTWKTASWRDERILNRMPPFDLDALSGVMDCDAVHINFINGTEFDLPAFKAFRNADRGVISLDVHQIISRFDAEGKREIVGFRDWAEWAPHVDILQCNEFEVAAMLEPKPANRTDFLRAARTICAAGPRAVVITLGPDGALLVHRKDGAYYAVDLGVLPQDKIADTTGCGDSFSAGFLWGLLTYDDPVTALACGAAVAGVNARYSGIGRLAEAKAYLADPRSHFPALAARGPIWPGDPLFDVHGPAS